MSSTTVGHKRLPALDALRGLAVAAVLLFHAGIGVMPGGFLGVSLFFTLSGFLITSLILPEMVSRSVRLRAFWIRRARRLLPAALLVVAAVVCFASVTHAANAHTTAGDGAAALLDVANWHFLWAGRSYASLFAAPSPLQHFWSLSIEEQYYLVFPLVAWMCARMRRPRAALVAVLLGVMAVSVRAATAGWSTDRMYYGTDVRAAEIAMGALLAVAFSSFDMRRLARAVRWAEIPALVFGAWAMLRVSEQSRWLYRGGFLALAACWSVLVAGAALETGVVGALGRMRRLVWLGTISYAVYVVHWPLYLVVHPTGHPVVDVSVAAALSVAVAAWFHGSPDRMLRRARFSRRDAIVLQGTGGIIVVTVALAAFVTPVAAGPLTAPPSSPPRPAARLPAAPIAPRLLVIGDSTAVNLASALERTPVVRSGRVVVASMGVAGCPLVDATRMSMVRPSMWSPVPSSCRNWAGRSAPGIASFHPDAVIVMFGPTQTADVTLPGTSRTVSAMDAAFTAGSDGEAATLHALAPTAQWWWVTSPQTFASGAGLGESHWIVNDAARTAAWNAMVRGMPGRVLDVAAWVDGLPGGWHNAANRPDGMHLSDARIAQLAAITLAVVEPAAASRG